MNDIYWLITLSNLSVLFGAVAIATGILLAATIIIMLITIFDEDVEKVYIKKFTKIFSISFAISILGYVFIPNEQQLYAIYGIGGVIDYVKSNDTAKQIPDKVVNYLDAWIDKQIEDEKKNNKD